MFKPSQVGDFPIIKVGANSGWNPTTAQVQGQVEDQIRPVFQRATVRGNYDSVVVDENSDFTLAAASGFTLGLAVDGTHPDALPVHVVYSYAASIHSRVIGANNRAGVNLRAFIGRSSRSTLRTTGASASDASPQHAFLLPNDAIYIASDRHAVSTTDREFSHISGKGQLVLEPTEGAEQDFPLFVCVNVMSPDGESTITITNISMSMALHKYVSPLDVFDPER